MWDIMFLSVHGMIIGGLYTNVLDIHCIAERMYLLD